MPSPAGKRTHISVYVSNVRVRRGSMRIAPRTPSAAGCRVHMVVSLLPQKNLKYKTIFKWFPPMGCYIFCIYSRAFLILPKCLNFSLLVGPQSSHFCWHDIVLPVYLSGNIYLNQRSFLNFQKKPQRCLSAPRRLELLESTAPGIKTSWLWAWLKANAWDIRYGASLRKTVKKMEISQHSKYLCTFCGKDKMKRQATGIWFCNDKNCRIKVAGGAYTYTTTAAASIR